MRIWLCEGAEGILINSGVITGAHPVLVESIAIIQESAALCGLRLYWTLLDGHSSRDTNDPVTRAIMSEPEHTARFAELVAAPIATRLDRRLTVGVEVINEPEALMTDDGRRDEEQWRKCPVAIKAIGDAVRAARSGTMVTAGTDRAMLAMLWNNAPGLDAVDIHVKGDQQLPSRADVIRELGIALVQAESIPLIGGYRGDGAEQTHRADYNAIFRWCLEPKT
ncbi:MAG TPA: hypothetical protein VKV03_10135 [Candidatus Binataceae bacterium]|nr:hypothetical protein [Candidatus Binataceae bacterium]